MRQLRRIVRCEVVQSNRVVVVLSGDIEWEEGVKGWGGG